MTLKLTPNDPYQLGWDDGYAEGYACKLVDVTEPFMPAADTFKIEQAAEWLHNRQAGHMTYVDAIGLVRGILREGMRT